MIRKCSSAVVLRMETLRSSAWNRTRTRCGACHFVNDGILPNPVCTNLAFADDADYVASMPETGSPSGFPPARPSASADASRAAEMRRVCAMTVEQRIVEALSLHHQLRDFIPPDERVSPCGNKRN